MKMTIPEFVDQALQQQKFNLLKKIISDSYGLFFDLDSDRSTSNSPELISLLGLDSDPEAHIPEGYFSPTFFPCWFLMSVSHTLSELNRNRLLPIESRDAPRPWDEDMLKVWKDFNYFGVFPECVDKYKQFLD